MRGVDSGASAGPLVTAPQPDRLPHVREPDSCEPDVCIHCGEEWDAIYTSRDTDECSTRLRAALRAAEAAERVCALKFDDLRALTPKPTESTP